MFACAGRTDNDIANGVGVRLTEDNHVGKSLRCRGCASAYNELQRRSKGVKERAGDGLTTGDGLITMERCREFFTAKAMPEYSSKSGKSVKWKKLLDKEKGYRSFKGMDPDGKGNSCSIARSVAIIAESSPAVSLEYDAATGQFSLASDISDETDESEGTRHLESQLVFVGKHDSGRFLRSETAANQTTSASSKTTYNYIARSCPCDGTGRTYCLVDGISTGAIPDSCGVPWSGDPMFTMAGHNYSTFDTTRIGCFELNSQTVFIRNAWPVVVLWYGALTIFLIATSNGKFARAYIMNKLCPGLQSNERMVDRILARESEMRNRLRTAAMRAASVAEGPGRYLVRTRGVRIPNRGALRREDLSDEEERQEATRWWIEQAERLGILSPRQDVEWVLRTKTFNAEKERAKREQRHLAKLQARERTEQVQQESSISDEEDDTFECTICLANIEDGDQVGVLPCTHIFHSECLRLWIARKNACPLCQVTEIASPRPVQREDDSSSSAEGNSDGNGDEENGNTYST
ncbi:hypothetical protein ACHAXT_005440, partial [Thalassiosira profunda]